MVNRVNTQSITVLNFGTFDTTETARIIVNYNVNTEITESDLIEVYPNPFTENLTIKILNYDGGNYTMRLYNSLGELLEINTLNKEFTIINTENLTSGFYFVLIDENHNGVKSSLKIIKN